MRSTPPRRSCDVLGVRLDLLDTRDVLDAVERMLSDGRAHQIVTVNPELVMRARRDPRFRETLERSDLATVDGVGVALAIRLLYGARAPRVTGADLVVDLSRLAAERGWPVFLLGGKPGVAEAASLRLREAIPGLPVAGTWAGGPDPSEDRTIMGMVRSGGARLLFVAYGAPAQEYWIRRNLPSLGSCVAIGVGGALDYLAGAVPRAPRLVRSAGLEWLYRLVRQPWRWRRQAVLPVYALLVLEAWARRRLRTRRKR